jgi:hypothetical protein
MTYSTVHTSLNTLLTAAMNEGIIANYYYCTDEHIHYVDTFNGSYEFTNETVLEVRAIIERDEAFASSYLD